MDVRELITELLECDLNADVSIVLETDEGSLDVEGFVINETHWAKRAFVSLEYESEDMVLIEKGELEALKNRIEELEEEL